MTDVDGVTYSIHTLEIQSAALCTDVPEALHWCQYGGLHSPHRLWPLARRRTCTIHTQRHKLVNLMFHITFFLSWLSWWLIPHQLWFLSLLNPCLIFLPAGIFGHHISPRFYLDLDRPHMLILQQQDMTPLLFEQKTKKYFTLPWLYQIYYIYAHTGLSPFVFNCMPQF